jgi:hypothetical protein
MQRVFYVQISGSILWTTKGFLSITRMSCLLSYKKNSMHRTDWRSDNALYTYLGSAGFESRPRHRLTWVFRGLPKCLQENYRAQLRFLSFSIHYSSITISFEATERSHWKCSWNATTIMSSYGKRTNQEERIECNLKKICKNQPFLKWYNLWL